jgi:hypothetical protein
MRDAFLVPFFTHLARSMDFPSGLLTDSNNIAWDGVHPG